MCLGPWSLSFEASGLQDRAPGPGSGLLHLAAGSQEAEGGRGGPRWQAKLPVAPSDLLPPASSWLPVMDSGTAWTRPEAQEGSLPGGPPCSGRLWGCRCDPPCGWPAGGHSGMSPWRTWSQPGPSFASTGESQGLKINPLPPVDAVGSLPVRDRRTQRRSASP